MAVAKGSCTPGMSPLRARASPNVAGVHGCLRHGCLRRPAAAAQPQGGWQVSRAHVMGHPLQQVERLSARAASPVPVRGAGSNSPAPDVKDLSADGQNAGCSVDGARKVLQVSCPSAPSWPASLCRRLQPGTHIVCNIDLTGCSAQRISRSSEHGLPCSRQAAAAQPLPKRYERADSTGP